MMSKQSSRQSLLTGKQSTSKGSRRSSIKNSKESRSSKISIASETQQKIEQRDKFIGELWNDIYDSAFTIVYEKYLEEQTLKLTVHCACEAALKIVGWNFLTMDLGEQLTDLDIFKNDHKPQLSDPDPLMENGEKFPDEVMKLIKDPVVPKEINPDQLQHHESLEDIYKNEQFNMF